MAKPSDGLGRCLELEICDPAQPPILGKTLSRIEHQRPGQGLIAYFLAHHFNDTAKTTGAFWGYFAAVVLFVALIASMACLMLYPTRIPVFVRI